MASKTLISTSEHRTLYGPLSDLNMCPFDHLEPLLKIKQVRPVKIKQRTLIGRVCKILGLGKLRVPIISACNEGRVIRDTLEMKSEMNSVQNTSKTDVLD